LLLPLLNKEYVEHAIDQPKTENAQAFPVHHIVHSTPDIEHIIMNNSFINYIVDTYNCRVYSVSGSSPCINILCLIKVITKF
jgi:hypothetical protein